MDLMVKFGFHVSISDSIDKAVDRAQELGCDTFQIFTRNPRSWTTRELTVEESEAFRAKRAEAGIDPVYGHMPYILNLASPDKRIYGLSVASLRTGLARCGALGIPMLVTHMGSHLGEGLEKGVERVARALDAALEKDDSGVMILLETGPGSRNSVGPTFEEVGRIIERTSERVRVGVCFDTCHVFVAGYEIRTPEGLGETIDALERAVGLGRLGLVHLNDSRGSFGSGNDHHEHLGLGEIGLEGLRLVANSRLARAPMIMETPIDERRGNPGNMDVARSFLSSGLRQD
jgi:deoxyribonuclease-4